MNIQTGRADHIEDYLVKVKSDAGFVAGAAMLMLFPLAWGNFILLI